ncbi:HET-domain-containing protein [Hypoxylon sp. NC1633]|nr:HET-domain-containing protein [Hypoxylon sp. NC1633]
MEEYLSPSPPAPLTSIDERLSAAANLGLRGLNISPCPTCYNLSLAVFKDMDLPETGFLDCFDGTYAGWSYDNGFNLLRLNYKHLRGSEFLGCHFCKFLVGVIHTFNPNPLPIDYMICLELEDEGLIQVGLDPLTFDSDSVECRLDIYRPEHLELGQYEPGYGHIPARRDLKPPDSEESFDFLKSCLKTCIETHDLCRQTPSSPPRRLLHIGSPGDSWVNLYEPPADFREPYVALSYCWGGDVRLKTLRENIHCLMQGFRLAQLPAAVKDAAYLTRKLGVKYLWVDALCIVQDSKADWEEQSAKMCSIYERSYLTILASTAGSAGVSFLSHSFRPSEYRFRVDNGSNAVLVARTVCRNGSHYGIDNTAPPDPIITRGWTLQELVLATRTISYSTEELQWQCKSVRDCECKVIRFGMNGVYDYQAPILWAGKSQLEVFDMWDQIVQTYTQRQLSHPEDKLPALSGVCQLIHKLYGWRYVAGLWEEALIYHLLWSRSSEDPVLPPQYRAPSFSWTSVDCAVGCFSLYPVDEKTVLQEARLIDFTILLAGADPYGQVMPGSSLTMAGKLIQDMELIGPRRDLTYDIPSLGKHGHFTADVGLETFYFKDSSGLLQRSVRRSAGDSDKGLESGSTVALFMLVRIEYKAMGEERKFLVLGVSPSDHRAYERLGVVTIQEGDGEKDPSKIPDQNIIII